VTRRAPPCDGMAGYKSVAAAGKSIERLINACFSSGEPVEGKATRAVLVRTEDFKVAGGATAITFPALSIYLYRVEFNRHMRAAWSAVGSQDGLAHLPLDLHFLLTAWADNAEHEYQIVGRAMQCLEERPILSGPLLYPTGEWATGEAIQLVLEEVGTEAVMRTFDSLTAEFRLSIPYVARIVRVDGSTPAPSPPVTEAVTGLVPS
jgi:Pvc16 N-terminal domain